MQLKHAKILAIDDDPDILTAIRLLLKYLVKEIITPHFDFIRISAWI